MQVLDKLAYVVLNEVYYFRCFTNVEDLAVELFVKVTKIFSIKLHTKIIFLFNDYRYNTFIKRNYEIK